MLGWKEPESPKGQNNDLSQHDSSGVWHGNPNDSDLEAQLVVKSNGGIQLNSKPKPKPILRSASDLERMVSESMRDIGSDEDLCDDDDDSEILKELQGITGEDVELAKSNPSEELEAQAQQKFLPTTTIDTISIIKSRIEMYQLAETTAQNADDLAKVRRFSRGLKTLNDLLKQSLAGNTINVNNIPPEVSVKSVNPASEPSSETLEAPNTTISENDNE